MFSGLEFTKYSGRIIGAHQRIDRIARRHLQEVLSNKNEFPKIRSILHFEGKNGPDGIKVKSPGRDEPWHYFDPLSNDNAAFMRLLEIHYDGLVKQLKKRNYERAAFEAAWLAHAIVDGLTPAHHYPFEQKISELRDGKHNSTRTTYKDKMLFSGKTKRQTVKNMVKAYGPRGIYMGHWLFEFGFSGIILPLRFPDARPTPEDIELIGKQGYKSYFLERAEVIAKLKMYDEYLKSGWKPKLVREVRQELAPIMIKTVTVLWYDAARKAGL